MSDRASPIGKDYMSGKFGNLTNGPGVSLTETHFGFLCELAAFPHAIEKIDKLVAQVSNKTEGAARFKIGANRWFVAGTETLKNNLASKLKTGDGSLIELTHGRTSLQISGPKAEWVLSKLFAIDFSAAEFPVSTGLSTTHHGILAQIHRYDEQKFDLFVFRSLARSFWHTLTRAAENVGYEVV